MEDLFVVVELYNGTVNTVYTNVPAKVAIVESNPDDDTLPLVTSLSDALDNSFYLMDITDTVVLDNLHDIWQEMVSVREDS